jgi:four helix bundle protein
VTSDRRTDEIRNFEDLEIWQEAHSLTLKIYKMTKKFPQSELYGLTSQLRRSAASVAANIVEGHSRNTTKEFIKYLFNARASVAETEYHLILAKDLGYVNQNDFCQIRERYQVLGRRINALIKSLKRRKTDR